VLLAEASADRSWGALGIALVISPTTNGVIALIGLACAPIVKRRAWDLPVRPYLLASVFLPVAAVVADFVIITAMEGS